MNEIEAMRWHLGQHRAVLLQQIDRLYNALEELQRTSLLYMDFASVADGTITAWLEAAGFTVDEDGFFQSQTLRAAFTRGLAPADAVSVSWGAQLRDNPLARQRMYRYRNIGPHLKHIHDRLGDVGWIYYQDAGNTALQYPYIDQRTAIPSDFDWSAYHTFLSVCPENNPERRIRWTPPTIDYAGEGLILSVSIPVWHREAFIGLWSIDLPIRYLYRDFSLSRAFPEQMQFIANRDGLVLLHEKLQAEIDQTKGRVFLHSLAELHGQWANLDLRSILAEEEGVLEVTDGSNTQWIFCHCFVPGVEWTLFSGLPRASMEEAAEQRLEQAFRQIADGNFSHRIESSPSNVFSTLAEEFNKMSQRLSQAEQHRVEIEAQLRQAQKMEAVGRLAGGVAHDYNNMTNVIMGYSELILEKLEKHDPIYADLQQINEAARRSMELTRQLLAFARCQAIAPKVLDINATVESMLKMLQRLIGEDIGLIWHPDAQTWPIEIDPSQVDQILANLCVNARDAINGVGTVLIQTANIVCDEGYCLRHRGAIPGDFVRLTVRDDGAGMDAAVLDKIFEPFFSTKVIGRGTGLGLATVYGIIKQNKGFVEVSSELGQGTAFDIYLPRALGQAAQGKAGSLPAPGRGHNETVLLVEDEKAILRLVERLLGQMGYRVLATQSPLTALTIAEQHPGPIDLLLTDVVMPEQNGSDLAKHVRKYFPDIGVLFMSGYTANIIAHRGVLDQDVILVQKPFSRNELSLKIEEALRQAARRKA